MLRTIEPIAAGTLAGRQPASADFDLPEYGLRYHRVSALMELEGIDALVLCQPTNVRYLTGLRTWFWSLPPLIPIIAVLPRDPSMATIIDTVTERGGVEEMTWIGEPLLYGPADDPFDMLRTALESRGLSHATLGFELGRGASPQMSPNDLDRMRALLPHATCVDASLVLGAVRSLKSPREILMHREAARLIQTGFAAAFDVLRVGVSEIELTRAAARAMLDAGLVPGATPPVLILMAGRDRYRQPLQPSTERAVREGELVSFDGGCVVGGYHSDFARAAVVGELSPQARRQIAVVDAALAAAVAAVSPGQPIGDAWAAAQQVLDDAGVGGAVVNPHSSGHGIGLDHWELPQVAPAGTVSGDVLARPGMSLCIEPQIAGADGDSEWHDGLFMLEDQILVTASGAEVLTSTVPRAVHHA